MHIDRVELFAGQIPTRTRFSYDSAAKFNFVIMRVHAAEQFGTGETLHVINDKLQMLARSLVGKDAADLDDLLAYFQSGVVGHRELASIALHDLVGHVRNIPLHRVLGLTVHDPVHVMPCLFPENPNHAKQLAESFVKEGFTALKTKLYGNPDDDVALAAAVRSALPDGFVQGDLNCAYRDRQMAADAMAELSGVGMDALEDPLEGSFDDYHRLLEKTDRPKLILDAPSRGSEALNEICRLRCCDAVNLHPVQQGTFRELLQRAHMIRAAGLELQMGGTGFTGVGSWAYAQLARIVGGDLPFGELGGARDHGMPAATSSCTIPVTNGYLDLPELPGHGGQLNLDVLKQFVQEHISYP